MKFSQAFVLFVTICSIHLLNSSAIDSSKQVRYYENSVLTIKDGVVNLAVHGDSAQFFVIGDWGGMPYYPYRTIIEDAMSNHMSKLAADYNTQFQLAIGDNFYFEGVTDVNDPRFQQTFESVFDKEHLDTPWFVLAGNHDHRGNAYAQVEYTNHSKKWVMPDFNYTVYVQTNDGADDLIGILMLDTVLLCGNSGYDDEHDQPRYASVHEERFGQMYFQSVEDQLQKLVQSSVKYILVAGHFPVWSIAAVGPVQCLVDRLRPLLNKYNVSAYFCGHDHNLQHISDTYLGSTVEHILSGAANINQNSTDHIQDIPKDSLRFYWSVEKENELFVGGGVVVSATSQNMTINYFTSEGKSLYQTVIYPRKFL